MSDNVDQMNEQGLEQAREHLQYQEGMDAEALSDAEVLASLDKSYPGGAAQFNREERRTMRY